MRVEHALDVLRIDVLSARADDHVLQAALDIEPPVLVELAQVARAEPAVGSERFGRGFGILVIAQHDARRERHDLALARPGIDVLEPQLDARRLRSGRSEAHLRRRGPGQQRRGLGQSVTDGIGHAGLQKELLGPPVELRAADSEETQPAPEELHQLLARHAVQVAAHEPHAVECAPEAVGIEFGQHLVAVDLFDDERHDEHDRGPYRPQGRHQRRGRRRTVQIDHPRAHREGVDHADRAFVGMRQRQHREKRVLAADGEDRGRHVHLRAERPVGEHHPLGLRGRARGVDDDGQIVRRGHGRRPLAAHALRDDAEVFRAHHDVQPLDGPFRKAGEQTVGDQQRPGLRVLNDHVQLLAREIGQNGHGDHPRGCHGQVAYAPVGHVAAQQGHLVAGTEPRSGKRLLHPGDTAAHFGVGQLLALVHGKGDPRREPLRALTDQSVQCIDRHVKFRINVV